MQDLIQSKRGVGRSGGVLGDFYVIQVFDVFRIFLMLKEWIPGSARVRKSSALENISL